MTKKLYLLCDILLEITQGQLLLNASVSLEHLIRSQKLAQIATSLEIGVGLKELLELGEIAQDQDGNYGIVSKDTLIKLVKIIHYECLNSYELSTELYQQKLARFCIT